MFGNLVANRQLRQLRDSHAIDIDPFDEASLKGTHYTLRPGRVLTRRPDGKWFGKLSFSEDETYELEKDEYVIVEVLERVRINAEGVVGRFISASNNIEGGLLVVAGQIDHLYGTKGELLRFGVKNLLPTKNKIDNTTRLAHVEFFDLRGIAFEKRELSDEEKDRWRERRRDPAGDGPDYHKG